MKRLFIIKNSVGKQVGEDFESKMEAKKFRDILNESTAGHTIGPGPDHVGKHGQSTKYRENKNRG